MVRPEQCPQVIDFRAGQSDNHDTFLEGAVGKIAGTGKPRDRAMFVPQRIGGLMSIEAWNIVMNATIVVVGAWYGIWLKNIVNQQLKSKDSAIQALETALKAKQAEIAGLRSDTAPAITQAYRVMREHAGEVTSELQLITDELKRTKATAQMGPVSLLLAEARGLLAAHSIVEEKLGAVAFPGKKAPEFSAETLIAFGGGLLQTQHALNSEVEAKTAKAKQMMTAIKDINT